MQGWDLGCWCSTTSPRCTCQTDTADEVRIPGFSEERRLEPQITIGLLVDATGFPLMVQAFEGNKAETTTMLPTIDAFKAAHRLSDVTIVADAGMVSAGNQAAIEAAGLTYILGAKIPHVPYQIDPWRKTHAGQDIPDVMCSPNLGRPTPRRRPAGQHDRTIHLPLPGRSGTPHPARGR
jgi:hypothetical protein